MKGKVCKPVLSIFSHPRSEKLTDRQNGERERESAILAACSTKGLYVMLCVQLLGWKTFFGAETLGCYNYGGGDDEDGI